MQIERLDHLVLTVADIARACEFYTRVLGMEVVTFGEGRTALRFGQQKINLHPADNIPGRRSRSNLLWPGCFGHARRPSRG